MKHTSLKLNLNVKKTREQVFLDQMEQVVPWAALVELIAPYYPEGKTVCRNDATPSLLPGSAVSRYRSQSLTAGIVGAQALTGLQRGQAGV